MMTRDTWSRSATQLRIYLIRILPHKVDIIVNDEDQEGKETRGNP